MEKNSGNENGRPASWERDVIEKLAFASLNDSRKAWRWNLAFKIFIVVYLVVLLLISQSGNISDKGLSGKVTALVDLQGEISFESPAGADQIITGLRAAFEDKSAVGVILRANSPGGSPVQSAAIYDEIMRLREKYPDKPVYAVVTDVCASGCYYIVAAANRIYANPSSLVGSIGVLMDGFGFVEAMKKLGVERRLLTAGENKGVLDPFSPLDDKSRQHAQKMLGEVHQQFIDAVKRGRGAALKPNKEIFSGLFWSGLRAKELGLVDEFGSAGYVAREVLGAEEIVDYTVHENFLQRLTQQLGMAMGRGLATEIKQQNTGLR